jgi:hypothetical protein
VTPPSHIPTSDASPSRRRDGARQAAARLGANPDAVRAALDEFGATVQRREERRRAATRDLVAELYAHDGEAPSPERVDAEANAACAQEHDERLAAELRRLVPPPVGTVRRALTLTDRELDGDCQAALHVLATAPRFLAEFQPAAEQHHTAEQASLDRFAAREVEAAGLLEEAPGWQLRNRRRLRRELADLTRGRTAAAHRLQAAATRLAALQLRQAHRAAWLTQSAVQEVLGAGAAALQELHDRARASDATAELPALHQPVAPGVAR